MILLMGIPSEPSLGLVIEEVKQLDVPYVVFNQRHFANTQMGFEIENGQVTGWLQNESRSYRLATITGIYTRLMDFRLLPELKEQPENAPIWHHCYKLHNMLMQWCEISPARVLNRNAEIGSNYSKPYQSQLISQQGFKVPETLITNDPGLVKIFYKQHKKIIYKSISSIRSIVKTFEAKDMERLDLIRSCPTQFQQYIEGTNVRVHTIGGEAFAVAIQSNATDYRYTYEEGGQEILESIELSADIRQRCIDLSKALRLGFAGIDLIITPEKEVYCLEVNACPAFSYYEFHTGQPIASTVAKYLAKSNE